MSVFRLSIFYPSVSAAFLKFSTFSISLFATSLTVSALTAVSSMEAFRDSRFVCSEISVTIPTKEGIVSDIKRRELY